MNSDRTGEAGNKDNPAPDVAALTAAIDALDTASGAERQTAKQRIRAEAEALADRREQRWRDELRGLAAFIDGARAELAAINVAEIHARFIPTATDELEAIVSSNGVAANEILGIAEMLGEAAGAAEGPAAEAMNDAMIRLFEACSFEDINGQRIGKVVRMLRSIDERVAAILAAMDGEGGREPAAREAERDGGLLNGPQLPGQGIGQDAVDALLAGRK